MMWRTVIILGCYAGVVLTTPVLVKDIPMVNDDLINEKTDMAMSTLNLPSNATSIRADITDGFNCDGRLYGYYADIENDCQIFHVCLPVTYPDGKENTFRWSFICPEDTIFSQESFTCVRLLDLGFDCAESVRFYDLNRNFGIAGNMDSDMHDMLRKTPADDTKNESLKPIVSVTTAAPLPARRRPVESNYRRQPTKATVTAAPTIKAKPTRIIPLTIAAPTTVVPVVKAKPTRVIPTPTFVPVEIKPMFDRNEFLKKNPNNGLRKSPIRPIPTQEVVRPVEVVPEIESINEEAPAVEEDVKKISAVSPIESAPPMNQESIQPELNLEKEQEPILPLEKNPSDETIIDNLNLPIALNLPESQNEPAERPMADDSLLTRISLEPSNEQPLEQMSSESTSEIQKDEVPASESISALSEPEMLKISDSASSASTETKLSEEMVALPEDNIPKEPMAPMLADAEVPASSEQMNEVPMQSSEKLSPEMQQDIANEPLTPLAEEMQPEVMKPAAVMSEVLPELNSEKMESTMSEAEQLPAEPAIDPVVKLVLENSSPAESDIETMKEEEMMTVPAKSASDEIAPMVMSDGITKTSAEEAINTDVMLQEPVKPVEVKFETAPVVAEMPMEILENKDMIPQTEVSQDMSADMPSQDMDSTKSEAEPMPTTVESEPMGPMNSADKPSEESELPEMELNMPSHNTAMAEESSMPLRTEPEIPNIELQAPKLDMNVLKEESIVTPNELAMPNQESEPAVENQQTETELKMEEPAPLENEPASIEMIKDSPSAEDSNAAAFELEQTLKSDAENQEQEAEIKPESDEEMPAMNSEEQKSEIIKAISSLVNQATQDVVAKIEDLMPAKAAPAPSSDENAPAAPEMPQMQSEMPAIADMDTLMASPALLDDHMKSEMPMFIPVKVIMENEPLTKVVAEEPLPEIIKEDDALLSAKLPEASEMPESMKIAQSEPINVESPAAETVIVKKAETELPEKEAAQVTLETEPVAMMDKQEGSAPATLKAEIFPVPEEEVQIVEDQPHIEMGASEPSENTAGMKVAIPMSEQMQPEASSVSELSQDAAVSPTPDAALLVEAQPFFQDIIDLASNLVRAETMSAPADDLPTVLDLENQAKDEADSSAAPTFSKSPAAADVLDGAEMAGLASADASAAATFPEPIEEADKQHDLVNDLLRGVAPERIGELVERTDLPASAASRVDLARSLQRKLDPRKRRFLFKSSNNSR